MLVAFLQTHTLKELNSRSDRNACSLFCIESLQKKIGVSRPSARGSWGGGREGGRWQRAAVEPVSRPSARAACRPSAHDPDTLRPPQPSRPPPLLPYVNLTPPPPSSGEPDLPHNPPPPNPPSQSLS